MRTFRTYARGVAFAAVVGASLVACGGSNSAAPPPTSTAGPSTSSSAPAPSSTTTPTASATPTATPFTETPGPAGLTRLTTISGQITPKSVVASGDGIVVADNMIYSHTVTVYDRDFKLLKTIPDSIDAAAFGVAGHPGASHGGPVEAAFTPDKKYFYVSNYSMYGAGWGPEGHDTCSPGSHFGTSTVYRISRATLAIDQVIPVGVVPKFLEVTPDGTKMLVSNWCSYAVSVIDTASAKQTQLIPVGAYPRGIAVTADSKTAYIAIMGGSNLIKMDLTTYAKTSIPAGGRSPRHLILDPTGRYVYITLNGSGTVTKLDTTTNQIVAKRATGSDPRTMAMSPDGQFLYVVNYLSSSMTKIRASDFAIVQTVTTNQHPIGITVDAGTGRVWVADYGGTIEVFADRR